MKRTRKDKIETARELLDGKHEDVLACLTSAELDKLKHHKFEPATYLSSKITTVFTKTPEDKKTISELIAKLDKHAKDIGAEERTVVHLSKYYKE